MYLDNKVLGMLACVKCRQPVVLNESVDGLTCKSCEIVYPIRRSVPLMMLDEARRQPRLRIADAGSVRLRVQCMAAEDRPAGPSIPAKFTDISADGCAVMVRSADDDGSGMVGRKLKADIIYTNGGSIEELMILGVVVGVRPVDEWTYTVHVRFEAPIEARMLKSITHQA